MSDFHFLGIIIPFWIAIPTIYFLWVFVLLIAKRISFIVIKQFARKTKTRLDDIAIKALDLPANLLIFTSGGIVIEKIIPLLSDNTLKLDTHFLTAFKAVIVISIILFIDKLIMGLLKEYSPKVEILQSSGSIVRGVSRLAIFSLGILVLLDSFGVSITPIIASLGIGSLAVALALQPTLENFFAGVQIVIDKPVKVGQFIKLESGEEGYVHYIGWRSTWVRVPLNNMIVIPNNMLVNSKITNYYYPDMQCIVTIPVGVHYGSDLEKVERVTVEVAKEVQNAIPEAVKGFEAVIRYDKFDASSINFNVVLRIGEYTYQGAVKHEFIKRLHKRYKKENITMPYPIQAVNYEQEQAFASDDFLKKA